MLPSSEGECVCRKESIVSESTLHTCIHCAVRNDITRVHCMQQASHKAKSGHHIRLGQILKELQISL